MSGSLIVQAGAALPIVGTVTAAGAPVDLGGSTIAARVEVGATTADVAGVVEDAATGRFSLRLDESLTATWAPGASGRLRLTRVVGGDVLPLGVVGIAVR